MLWLFESAVLGATWLAETTLIGGRHGLELKELRAADMEAIEPVDGHGTQGGKSVANAPLEIDAACFREITDGHGDIAQPKTATGCLHQELRIEDEIIRVALVPDPLQDLAPVDAEAAVKIAQVLAQ